LKRDPQRIRTIAPSSSRAPSTLLARLARPSAAYKRHAWLALAGLAVFIALYLLLAGWFVYTAWKLTIGSANTGKDAFWGWVIGASAALLAVFMLKAIFFVNRGKVGNVLEVTRPTRCFLSGGGGHSRMVPCGLHRRC
jgi:hypothetical protein